MFLFRKKTHVSAALLLTAFQKAAEDFPVSTCLVIFLSIVFVVSFFLCVSTYLRQSPRFFCDVLLSKNNINAVF